MKKGKVVLVGTGFVGMSMAYSMLNRGGVSELVLIDIDKDKTIGEQMDLSHGLPFAPQKMIIKAGDYDECKDAQIVVITAGIAQKPGQTRLELTETNTKIMKSITKSIMASGFNGVIVVASNPVDIMTYVVQKVSGLPAGRVIGSGTMLDTARLRYLLGERLKISPKNTHAYVMGEHGDSQMIPWSQVTVGAKRIIDILRDSPERFRYVELDSIRKEIAKIAYQIVKQKGATNYGIAAVAARMIKAIIQDENIVMPLSVMPHGEYGLSDLYLGIPAVLNGSGIRELVEYHLTNQEHQALLASAAVLQEANQKVQQLVKW